MFEHPCYGVLPVTDMLDLDGEATPDIALACRLVCRLPDGSWLVTCACPCCGTLRLRRAGDLH